MSADVRRLAGPFATRVCRRVDGGYAWQEEAGVRLTGLLDPDRIPPLAAVVPRGRGAALLPRTADAVVTWATVPTPALAFDVVFGATAEPLATTRERFRELGGFLAALHRAPVPAGTGWPGYGGDRVIRPVDDRLRAARDAARRRLAHRVGRPADHPPVPGRPVLVHGRFSLGQIAWGPAPRVLGWREAGVAAALTDVDTLLAELAEAAAIRPPGPAALAAAFLAGYDGPAAPGGPKQTAERLLARILDHLALRAAVTGDLDAPSALLDRVVTGLDDFCAEALAAAPAGGRTDVR